MGSVSVQWPCGGVDSLAVVFISIGLVVFLARAAVGFVLDV